MSFLCHCRASLRRLRAPLQSLRSLRPAYLQPSRLGPQALPADPRYNPEVNLGTGTLDRNRWEPVVGVFLAILETLTSSVGDWTYERILGLGGYFSRWTHQKFPGQRAC